MGCDDCFSQIWRFFSVRVFFCKGREKGKKGILGVFLFPFSLLFAVILVPNHPSFLFFLYLSPISYNKRKPAPIQLKLNKISVNDEVQGMTVCPLKIDDKELEEEEKKMITWKDTLQQKKKKFEKPVVTEEFLEDLKINKNLLKSPTRKNLLSKYKIAKSPIRSQSEKDLSKLGKTFQKTKSEQDLIDLDDGVVEEIEISSKFSENQIIIDDFIPLTRKNTVNLIDELFDGKNDDDDDVIVSIEETDLVVEEEDTNFEFENDDLPFPLIEDFDIIEPPPLFQNPATPKEDRDSKMELIEKLIDALGEEYVCESEPGAGDHVCLDQKFSQNFDKLLGIYQKMLNDTKLDSEKSSIKFNSKTSMVPTKEEVVSFQTKTETDLTQENETDTLLEPRDWDFDDLESLAGASNKWTDALCIERLNKGNLKTSHSDVCILNTTTTYESAQKKLVVNVPSVLDRRDSSSAPALFIVSSGEPVPQKRRKIENALYTNINVIKQKKQEEQKKKKKRRNHRCDTDLMTPRFKELLNFLSLNSDRNEEEMLTLSRKQCIKLLNFDAKILDDRIKLPHIGLKSNNNNNNKELRKNVISLPPLNIVNCGKEKRIVNPIMVVGQNFDR